MMMKRFVLPALIGAGLVAAVTAVQGHAENTSRTYRQFDQLVDVFERIRAEYVEDIDEQKVLESAIEGMLSSLDPHSSYMGPETFRAMQVQTEGEFGGLGIEVSMKDGFVLVVAPIDDTPAARAGVESGDLIVQIDGEPVQGLSQMEAIKRMRGPAGTPIVITVMREGVDEPFDIRIIRDIIKVRSVRHEIHDDVGYIRISTFNRQTSEGLRDSLQALRQELGSRMTGLVLDLRANPGGLLDQAVEVSDAFLEHGEIVSTRSRNKANVERYTARAGDLAAGLPIVVLVNAYSASASEIVAGALQDHKRAIVLGVRSFGKGTVQTIIPLGPDSAMRLTTARYYTPAGRSIQEMGIAPDIEVVQPPRADAASNEGPRREADLPGHFVNENGNGDNGEDVEKPLSRPALTDEAGDPVEDYQLAYALKLLKSVGQYQKKLVMN
ncbi:MAG: S41 family peptidase [Sphingomonadales bacterium]